VSELHEFLAGRFRQMVQSDTPERTAVAAPRGNAKTTWTSVIADFGDLMGDPLKDRRTWTKQRIATTTGIQVSVYGSGKSLRGIKKGASRPDLLIGDDLENSEHVLTPGQRRKLLSWWTKDATKIGGPAGLDIFVVGTILHYDSLLSGLLQNPGYMGRKFKAVISWPARTDLWDQWDSIYSDLSRIEPQRKADALALYETNRQEMERGSSVLWPAGDSLYHLMMTYTDDGPAAFDSEKQNEPVNPDDCLFEEGWFSWWLRPGEQGEAGDLPMPPMQYTIGAVDPSLGRHAHRGDYSAILVLGRGNDNRDYILEASIERRSPDQIIEDTITLHRQHQCREWAVEAVAFQQFFADEMGKRSLAAGLHLPIVPVHPSTDKVLRISSLQPSIRAGNIVFHRSQRRLYDQMRLFPLADHDDGPDALHMAYERGQHQAAPAIGATNSSYGGGTGSDRRDTGRSAPPMRGGIFAHRSPGRR